MQPWNVFIAHSMMDTAQNLAVNLGAPGDMKDHEGNVWFAYPNPVTRYAGNHYPDYGVKFNLNEKTLEGMGYFCYDSKGASFEGTDKPWLFTSGCVGLSKLELPLVDTTWGGETGFYTIQMGFAPFPGDRSGQRVFDVKIQGDTVLKNFDIAKEAGSPNEVVVKEFKGVMVKDNLLVEFVSDVSTPTALEAPVLNFIKAVRDDKGSLAKTSTKPMDKGRIEELLREAKMNMDNGNKEKALEIYHTVFDAAPSMELKQLALEGMSSIGSPKSLSRIASYCRDKDPIMWDYKSPDPKIKDEAIKVCVAIAKNVAKSDKEKAIDMLESVMNVVEESDTRQQITDSLEDLGVKIESQ
jgi:hypothetical protein